MDTLLMALPLPPIELLVALLGVALAYVVFGMAGFGTALVAGPVLAHLVPLATSVPLLALGLFAVGYALYQLSGIKPVRQWPARAACPFGLVGGVFSALFGSGGFLYAIHLSGRITVAESFRVTQSALIGLSTLTRVLLFLLAGVYADRDLLSLALLLVPAMWGGGVLGRRIGLRLSRAQFLRIVSLVVLGSGLALMGRYLGR